MTRAPYTPPRLQRLGNVADITQGTGTGPGPLSSGGSSLGPGPSSAPVKIYGDYSTGQIGDILNGSGGR